MQKFGLWWVFFIVSALIITIFLVLGDLQFFVSWIETANNHKLLVVGICLLALLLDVFLPVPSSIVMILTGSILGFWAGFIVCTIGIVASNLLGYAFGHLWNFKGINTKQKRLLESRGWMAVLFTRGIPVLAESMAITAGIAKFPLKSFFLACVFGNIPYCLLYCLSGNYTFGEMEMLYAFLINLLLIVGIFFLQQKISPVIKS